KRNAVESLRKVLGDEYTGVDDAALADLEARREQVAAALEALRRRRDNAQTTLGTVRAQHGKTAELRKGEATHAELQGRAREMACVRAQIDAAGRAAPLLPLLDEAARATTNAAAARGEAEKATTEQETAQAACEEKSTDLAAAEKAAEAIPALRQQIAQL